MSPGVFMDGEPTPAGKRLARRLRRAASDTKLGAVLEGITASVVVRSATDPQRVTVRFAADEVHVEHGADPEADLTLVADLWSWSLADAILDVETSPADLVARVGCVLSPPLDWRDAATRFWERTSHRPGTPAALLVVCTDRDKELRFGDPGSTPYEIHGPSSWLVAFFEGEIPLLDLTFGGFLTVVGTLDGFAVMQGNALAEVLGDVG